MFAQNDNLIFVEYSRPSILKSIDIQTGHENWATEIASSDAIGTNSNFVFVGGMLAPYVNRPDDVTCNSITWDIECDWIELAAYDIQAGKQLWSNVYPGMALISQVTADKSTLQIRGSGTKGASHSEFVISTHSGELLEIQQPNNYLDTSPINLSVPENNTVQMATEISHGDSFSVFLSKDATLWLLDQNTDSVSETLKFDGPQIDFSDGSKVIVNGNIIIIYFRDTKQLFAFKYLNGK